MSLEHEGLAAELAAAAALEKQYPDGRFEGRGIVICAGGPRMFTCAWVCIGILRRHLGCTLPIEVWHMGPEEMGPPMRSLLEGLGAQAVDAFEVAKRHEVERLGGWELKSYAMLHSRFREVLLLDADNVPVREPSYLFERPEYQETGALFWPDVVRLSSSNGIWAIAGLAPHESPSFESGQIVLDKSKCWRALSLAYWMNQRSEAFYNLVGGDKDSFLIAWLVLGQPFHLIQRPVKRLESTACQFDPDGRILFQHRSGAKWILDGVNPRIEGFRLERECLDLLDQLASLWDGCVFNPPPRSNEARRLEQGLAQTRDFRFVRVSSDERPMELLDDHRVGAGAGGYQFYWYVTDGEEGFELRLEGGGYRTCALRCSDDGVWRGRLLSEPGMPIELIPAGPASGAAPVRKQEAEPTALRSLLDCALTAYASLPQDEEVRRDFAGFMRTLAVLDPAVGACLREELEGSPSSSERARMIRLALDGLADSSRRSRHEAVAPGHNWNNHPSLREGYV
jgi:hypothetical protein